jgi:hypothetical protein
VLCHASIDGWSLLGEQLVGADLRVQLLHLLNVRRLVFRLILLRIANFYIPYSTFALALSRAADYNGEKA